MKKVKEMKFTDRLEQTMRLKNLAELQKKNETQSALDTLIQKTQALRGKADWDEFEVPEEVMKTLPVKRAVYQAFIGINKRAGRVEFASDNAFVISTCLSDMKQAFPSTKMLLIGKAEDQAKPETRRLFLTLNPEDLKRFNASVDRYVAAMPGLMF